MPVLAAPWDIALAVWLVVSAVLMPLGMFGRRSGHGTWGERVAVAGLFAMGLFSSLLVATFLRDVMLIAIGLVATFAPVMFAFSRIESVSAEVVPLLALAVTLIGLWNARRIARVVEVDVPIDGLPPAARRLHHRADQRRARRPDHQARSTSRRSSTR